MRRTVDVECWERFVIEGAGLLLDDLGGMKLQCGVVGTTEDGRRKTEDGPL